MIRPTFLSFETAKKAIAIGQLGLDTVGHNIANASTPGYTRQRVDQISLNSAGYKTKYSNFGVQFPGQGADVNAITQIRDPYLDNRYRLEATTYGELGIKADGLSSINTIFDEIQTNGLHAKMGDLYTALDKLLAQADSNELAMVVRNTASEMTGILHDYISSRTGLDNARETQTNDLITTVAGDVNDTIEKIADLNVKIKEDHFYGNPSNELVDERNVLIDKLSEYLDIKVVKTPVKISDSLTIERLSIELQHSGDPPVRLIDSGEFHTLSVSEDPANGNVAIKVMQGKSEFELDVSGVPGTGGDITGNLYRGGLKGFIDIINGVGPNMGEGNTYRGIPYYQNALNEYAAKLAESFNRVNNVTPEESAKNGGIPSATVEKNLFVPNVLTIKDPPAKEPPAVQDPPASAWMQNITSGWLEFSGKDYNINFTVDTTTTPEKVTATIDGIVNEDGTPKEFVADFKPGEKMNFREVGQNGDEGAVAFSILSSATATATDINGTKAVIDANITASNITVSNSWLRDPLYLTATKNPPSTKAEPKLEIAGTPPSWLKSIEIPTDSKIPPLDPSDPNAKSQIADGRYQFKEVTDAGTTDKYVQVNINGTVYTSKEKLPWSKNSRVEFVFNAANPTSTAVPPDATFSTGFTITTSASPALNATDSTKNILEVKNVTAAANDNIFKFKELYSEDNSYSVSGFSGSFEEFLVNTQSEASLDQSTNESKLNASSLRIGALADSRDAVSAVSVDEEGISMMQYQNFYNAASRYMTTLDEALDKIINGMGTVGR